VPDPSQKPRSYQTQVRVRFADCDPAGIVFYPRYFEMFNGVVEDWFRSELHASFTEIVSKRGWGLPTVHLEVDFVAPSRFDETLLATLTVNSLGTSSVGLDIVLRGPDRRSDRSSDKEDRVRGKVVLVLIDRAAHRAIPWPEELRARILAFQTNDSLQEISHRSEIGQS
jgi:4-hydroxybenzoyl-CoA thioesterase